MRPVLRKLNLTAHVSTLVGWLGAVAMAVIIVIHLAGGGLRRNRRVTSGNR